MKSSTVSSAGAVHCCPSLADSVHIHGMEHIYQKIVLYIDVNAYNCACVGTEFTD